MPLYIPWLSETIKKRGVRYLLHHYLGHFFDEKLTLEQLSVDIYEGKGSIKDLTLDVNGLNDELDFVPFKFLDGCSIGQISVEVPWSSLSTEACQVELEGAKFICRLKNEQDLCKSNCNESTLLTRSLMTTSMQMAEEIVTTEDDDDFDSPSSSHYKSRKGKFDYKEQAELNSYDEQQFNQEMKEANPNENNKMFEGLEMFAQLIDSVLRRTKLTAYNTTFQIQASSLGDERESVQKTNNSDPMNDSNVSNISSSSDCPPNVYAQNDGRPGADIPTVEFHIRYFRCEEVLVENHETSSNTMPETSGTQYKETSKNSKGSDSQDRRSSTATNATTSTKQLPETIEKLLTLEDIEMRISGKPVSNLIGRHTIRIKFDGQKSDMHIYLGSPLLAVINSHQLKTFMHVFNPTRNNKDLDSISKGGIQKVMRSEDYAKIETQLLQMESAGMKCYGRGYMGEDNFNNSGFVSPSSLISGRRWTVGNVGSLNSQQTQFWPIRHQPVSRNDNNSLNQGPNSVTNTEISGKKNSELPYSDLNRLSQPVPLAKRQNTFDCELKMPGVWLCILKSSEELPDLISPYSDSNNSFSNINKFLDKHIKVPHIRALALRVSLNVSNFLDAFLGDIQLTEYIEQRTENFCSKIPILTSDTSGHLVENSRYHISSKHKEIVLDLLTKTKFTLDPTFLDRSMAEYGLMNLLEEQMDPNSSQLINQNPSSSELAESIPKTHGLSSTSSCHGSGNLNIIIKGEQIKFELLCPIPDLRPEAANVQAELRPQSFIFNLNSFMLSWHSSKLTITSRRLQIAMKNNHHQQTDAEAIRFLDAICNAGEKISLVLEPSPSNLDKDFPDDEVEEALNEASMYDSIYVGQATESKIPTEVFQTKRKVVRGGSAQSKSTENECDSEKIIAPGDRQHLLDYLEQALLSTKLSLTLNLPRCEMDFQDKDQLETIYNRFGNDFVFWKPNFMRQQPSTTSTCRTDGLISRGRSKTYTQDVGMPINGPSIAAASYFSCRPTMNDSSSESEVSFHSLSLENKSDIYQNEATCKITVDDLKIRFNQQEVYSTAIKQEACGQKVLLGVILDVRGKPSTVICLALDYFELRADSINVLEGNFYGDKNSQLGLAFEIKRPSSSLKEIKFSARLTNTIFRDFDMDTYKRLWQAINLNDEVVLGYVPPKIVTEVHLDVVNTALSLVREGARPSLITMDELYLTSMVVAKTSQVMLRLIADEASLYLKRNKQGMEVLKNYICVIDSGLIDLNVKFSEDGKIEFGVTNNVITTRVCQDSLFALFQLFASMAKTKSSDSEHSDLHQNNQTQYDLSPQCSSPDLGNADRSCSSPEPPFYNGVPLRDEDNYGPGFDYSRNHDNRSEVTLLQDAINDQEHFICDVFNREEQGEHHDNNQMKNSTESSREVQRYIFGCPMTDSANQDRSARSMSRSRDVNSSLTSEKTIEESGFFILGDDDVGAGIIDNKMHEPVIRQLTGSPIKIVENYFNMTKPKTLPDILATTLERYVLEEMSLIINLYGGRDFDDDDDGSEPEDRSKNVNNNAKLNPAPHRKTTNQIEESLHNERTPMKKSNRRKYASESSDYTLTSEPRVRFGDGAVNLWESLDLMSAPDILTRRSNQPVPNADFKNQGGAWRQNDVCVQLGLFKVKSLYESCDHEAPFSWRFMLYIQEIEVKDRVGASNINKMLYEYSTEAMPKRNNTDMLSIKMVATRNPADDCEECDLKISVKPLRLNIDQDTLIFLIEFFTSLSNSVTKSSNSSKTNQIIIDNPSGDTIGDLRTSNGHDGHGQKVGTTAGAQDKRGVNIRRARQVSESSDASFSFGSSSPSPPSLSRSSSISISSTNTTTTTMLQCNTGNATHPLYIRSFSFSPDVPIRLDYHGKRVDFEQGALAGVLMGLAQLDHSELKLKKVQAKHGMRGIDRVLAYVLNAWITDIKRNQLPCLLGGMGPMHSFIQLFQGVRDLVWMPIDQYRKDKRLVRGIQRGASSFSSSTAMAAIDLTNRFVSLVQCTAQFAHDIVTPPQSSQNGRYRGAGNSHHLMLNQPRNFCEGMTQAYTIMREGFNDTVRNVAAGMQADDMRGAMGELVRHIPSTLLNPIISVTEGAQNVLVGLRNQLTPEARRDDQDKWKTNQEKLTIRPICHR